MPNDLGHSARQTPQQFTPCSGTADPVLAHGNPTVRELLSRNGELALRNRQLAATLAHLQVGTTEPVALMAHLTPRQREVATLVLAGHPSKNIAADLNISQRTVENHRAAIMHRTGATSIPELVRLSLT